MNFRDGIMNKGVHIENTFNFGPAENHNDVDLVMRARTGLKNTPTDPKMPEFYTDANGLHMQRRSLVPAVGLEGNYYPVSGMTYLEDELAR